MENKLARFFPILIILISFLTLYPSFFIGLYGDDYLAIFRYVIHVLPPGGWNEFSYYLTPYGSQDILMGLLYQKFGMDAFYYEVTAYILRLVAAFSIYPLTHQFTKNKLGSFFAVLFFSITTIGFDSTGWLLTMPTYLSIAFFNFFIYFYVRSHDNLNLKFLLISGLFYYLAYITASARMIGAPLFILSLEIFWIIQNHKLIALKKSLLRLSMVTLVMVLIATLGQSLGSGNDWISRLNSSLHSSSKMLSEGRVDFILYPITTMGGMILPYLILPNIQLTSKVNILFSVVLPISTIFLFILFLLKTNIERFKKTNIYKHLLIGLVWIFIVFIFRKINPDTFSSSNVILMTITGGLFIILWGVLSLKFYLQKNISTALFISLSWTICSFFIAWFWNPTSYIDTTHRYLTTSAVGVSLFLGVLISLGQKYKDQFSFFLFLTLLLILHINSTKIYIDKLLFSHSQKTIDNIWASIPNLPDAGDKALLLYFERDDSNAAILSDSVLFGFPFHISLLYKLNESHKIPGATDDWKVVKSAIRDGQSLKPFGYPLKPILIEDVYGFHLQGKDHLINITEEIRQKLILETKQN